MARLPMVILVLLFSISIVNLASANEVQISFSTGGGRRQLQFDKEKGTFKILQVPDMTPCEEVLPQQMALGSEHNTTDFIERMIKGESSSTGGGRRQLQFDQEKGKFKILQVADMHYADGKKTPCKDVLPQQMAHCSDLNTTVFVQRMINAEKPDLIVFTGDNIYASDATDAATSMNAAFAPAVSSKIPWAAVLGNHDQESSLSREGVMKHIVGMKHTLSQLNPIGNDVIDGFGNYNLEVQGVQGSAYADKSILNLYFLDSGDYSTVPSIPGYGWIKPSQQFWFQQTSKKLQSELEAPGFAYFHIPLPEYANFDSSTFTGVKQEGISSASINSGFFTTMVEAGDVKAVFTGHDHVNDFCGELTRIHLCYAGGFGYHAYGKAGWSRRARVVVASLEKEAHGNWGTVKSIKTWKRLDDKDLTAIDCQVLCSKTSGVGEEADVSCSE